jgi:predicted O-methyltransferase YrrM
VLNLRHNYHELSTSEKLHYWLVGRRRLSPQDRFFFEGHRSLPGQMYLAERKALYTAVLSKRPRYCFEIGTAGGGGSTFFIASAFRFLGSGQLVSLEASEPSHLAARRRYDRDLSYLKPYITLLHGASPNAFLPYIREMGSQVECLFLDGSDSPEESLSQYEFFFPYARPGTVLMAHDWNDVKMSTLRPVIERDGRWILRTGLTQPDSVGFVVYSFGP